MFTAAAAAAAKSLQSCPTLCDPIDGSPPGSPVPGLSDPIDCSLPGSSARGIFQARVLEWGAIAFSAYDLREVIKHKVEDMCFISLEWVAISFSRRSS